MRNLTVRLVLGALFVVQTLAAPITYQQVNQIGQQTKSPTADTKSINSQTTQTKTPESGDRPEFVRLADGRIVPYGPGVVCTDDCVQSEAFGPSNPSELRTGIAGINRWFLALPIVGGGILALAMLAGGNNNQVVLSTVDPPRIVTPTNPTEVPEPATLILLGLGLAMMARHGFGKKKNDEE